MPERAAKPRMPFAARRALRTVRNFTTPLRPDDYLELINPMWSTRELRGQIVEVRPETHDSATIVISTNFAWPGHRAGQYLRLGVEINGIRHWRAYTITADPGHPRGLVSVTVKSVDEGVVAKFLVHEATPGTQVYLGEVEGQFTLPDPVPARLLFLSAGSGVTPIHALLRELDRRSIGGSEDLLADAVHVYSARTGEAYLEARRPGYRRTRWISSEQGRLTPAAREQSCPDWRERATFLSGPGDMLDAFAAHWSEQGVEDNLSMERFQPHDGLDIEPGQGGTVHFRVSDTDVEVDGSTGILEAGEDAGLTLQFGCRMGICHTCVGRLADGRVRDLRTGETVDERGVMVRICVSCPEGPVEIDL